jgi:hypothetical protein
LDALIIAAMVKASRPVRTKNYYYSYNANKTAKAILKFEATESEGPTNKHGAVIRRYHLILFVRATTNVYEEVEHDRQIIPWSD